MVASLRDRVKSTLVSAVPEYSEMTRRYAEATEVINEIKNGLSLGTKASTDTAIKKLISSVFDNQDFRTDLIRQLEKTGGQPLLAKIAGMRMEEWVPSGLIGRSMAAGVVGGSIFGSDPRVIAGLTFTSPKLMGSLGNALSMAVNEYRRISPPEARLGLFQAGRQAQEQEERSGALIPGKWLSSQPTMTK